MLPTIILDKDRAHVTKYNDTGLIIRSGEKSLALINRHPEGGGKVTVKCGDKELGHMWNDEALIFALNFLRDGTIGTVPPHTPVKDRIVWTLKPAAALPK